MTKIKDWTGKRQGDLIIVKRVSEEPIIKWECKCNCGKTVVLTHKQLIQGIHNCLDYRFHRKMKNSIIIGDKFGALRVIDITINEKTKHPLYHCLCDCGSKVIRSRGGLVDVKLASCGCKRPEFPISEEMQSMIGKTYGDLTVLDVKRGKAVPELNLPKNHAELNKVFTICKCNVCGRISYPRASALRTGKITSCGHNQKANLNKGAEIWRKNSVYGTNLFSIGAKRSVNKNNTSGYRGISYHKETGKWRAYINFRRKQYNLGLYENLDDAIAARREAEERIYGNFLEWYHKNHSK